jgi:signal peptidase II
MGSVVDFMNVGVGSFRTGIFNVADVAILAGIGLLLAERYRARSASV